MWKTIYYGYYEINHKGQIRRAKRGRGTYIGKILKPYGAYPQVKLHKDGVPKQFMLDKLIARYL